MKRFITALFGIALVCGAHEACADSYLYWMLDDVTDPKLSFWLASIVAESDNGEKVYLTASPSGEGGSTWVFGANPDPTTGLSTKLATPYYAVLPSSMKASDGWSFYVELYGLDLGIVGVSQYAQMAEIQERFIYEELGQGGTTPYSFSASVPEPSCGLLVLFGLGLLGLKRREMKFEV